ncbi:MAG: BCCT family transporter [Thiohalospira sp.]
MSDNNVEDPYDTDHTPGDRNINPFGLDLHNPVFIVSGFLVVLFVILTLAAPGQANEILDGAKTWSIEQFDWLFLIGANIFLIFIIALLFLPVGRVRLGGQDAKPEFSTLSWFAMLFAAGMGIGLMFWGVAEPVAYYTGWFETPLGVEAETAEAQRLAMGATMYHWGLHPWAIYGVVALSLAFFAFNKGMPLTIRSAFYPLFGEKVWGWPGDVIDTLAVLATIFGLATSLGLGAQQAASGLGVVTGGETGLNTQIAIIVGVTTAALVSVVRGLDGGVKVLSNINMILAGILLFFVIVVGATATFFSTLFTTAADYVTSFGALSNPFGREDETWFHGWTVFYWAWWISWSPFVGMFIARVSRGRTVREFITAVLIVPTLVTLVWMAAFGGNGLEQASQGVGELAEGLGSDESRAMFQMFAEMPLAFITSLVAVLLVLVFFITSSDSGSLVIDSITAGGKIDAPQAQRIFWVVMEGLIAGVLLYVGGEKALEALQAGAVTTGLPFTVVLLLMCIGLYKGLHHERKMLGL